MKSDIQLSEHIALDEEIVQKAKIDPAAFRPLYVKYFKCIYLFVLHRTAHKEVSSDITSQVFLKALSGLGKYELRGLPFSSWLYRIATNECNSFFRRNQIDRTVMLDDEHAEKVYEEMFGDNTADELCRKLPDILQRLKRDELQLIELRFLEARAFKEVAEILNMTETHAKTKTYRTLEKMKKMFLGK